MFLVKDEMILQVSGHVRGHPNNTVFPEMGKLMEARAWSTKSTCFSADNVGEKVEQKKGKKMYPISFEMGLDHVPASEKDWFADVRAIVEYFNPVARATNSSFIMQFRLNSKPTYLITLQNIDGKAIDETDLTAIKLIIENEIETNRKRPWWRRIVGRR